MAHSASDVPSTVLDMLKVDLGLATINSNQTTYYNNLLAASWDRLEAMGMTLSPASVPDDAIMLEMYTAWIIRKRDTGEGMPMMVRQAIHDRQIREAVSS